MPFWVINQFSGFLKQWVAPIVRRNKNWHPVLWAPFYVASLVVTNLPGKSGMQAVSRAVFLLAQNMVWCLSADVTHFWVDRIWIKPLLDVTFLQDTTVARQNT